MKVEIYKNEYFSGRPETERTWNAQDFVIQQNAPSQNNPLENISDTIDANPFLTEMARGFGVIGAAAATTAFLASAPVTIPALVTLTLAGLAGAAINALSASIINNIHISSGHEERANYDLQREARWGFLYGLTAAPLAAWAQNATTLAGKVCINSLGQASVDMAGTYFDNIADHQPPQALLGRVLGAGITSALTSSIFEGLMHKLGSEIAYLLEPSPQYHFAAALPGTGNIEVGHHQRITMMSSIQETKTLTHTRPHLVVPPEPAVDILYEGPLSPDDFGKKSRIFDAIMDDEAREYVEHILGEEATEFAIRGELGKTLALRYSAQQIIPDVMSIRGAHLAHDVEQAFNPHHGPRFTPEEAEIIHAIFKNGGLIKNYHTIQAHPNKISLPDLLHRAGFSNITPTISGTLSDVYPLRWSFLDHEFYINPALMDLHFGDPKLRINNKNAFTPAMPDNLSRILKGSPPIGPDYLPLELHHLTRNNYGPLIMMTEEMHRHQANKLLHPSWLQASISETGDREILFDPVRRLFWSHFGHWQNCVTNGSPLPFDVHLNIFTDNKTIQATI